MPTDHAHRPWAIRSTLAVVADLDRSVDFYRELGPFDEIVREGAVAVLGEGSPASIVLILREGRSNYARRSQQSLGLRSITFNVGSSSELDRTESVLRGRKLFTSRRQLTSGGSELLYGRDPDNMPLVFVYYVGDEALGSDYYRTVADLAYSLDV
jgi:hypothetical protein